MIIRKHYRPEYVRGHLIEEIERLKLEYEYRKRDLVGKGVLVLSYITYCELQSECRQKGILIDRGIYDNCEKVCGLEIDIDNHLSPFEFVIKDEIPLPADGRIIMFDRTKWTKPIFTEEENMKIPKKYIINKGATVLFWEDGTKTLVKRSKDDKYDKYLGFLTAYFQKHCGMSKNKANKYLASLVEE